MSLGLVGCFAFAVFTMPQASSSVVVLRPPPESAADPYVLRYSQAVLLRAALVVDGAPMSGERIEFTLIDDLTGTSFLVDDPLTDALGVATARLTFVNGRYGGQTFPARDPDDDTDGHPYTVRAHFPGDLAGDDPACADTDGGMVDGGDDDVCGGENTIALFLQRENVAITLQAGNVVPLGDEITLLARVEDESGDAPLAGTEIDGDTPVNVANGEVSFFFDLNGNERPEAGELLGRESTDDNGIARHTFTVDPAIFPSGDFALGLHVQFSGDDRFGIAGAAGRITIEGGTPVATLTVIEATPLELPADGISRVNLKAILVDEGNNPLGVDAPAHTVRFTSALGTVLEETANLDVLTGHYTQELRAPESGGTSTVTVFVDDVEGSSVEILFVDEGCGCHASPSAPPSPLSFAAALTAVTALARRRMHLRRASRPGC